MPRAACTLRKPTKRATQVSGCETTVAVRFAKNMARIEWRPPTTKYHPRSQRFKLHTRGRYVINPLRRVPVAVELGLDAIMRARRHMTRGCTHQIFNVDPHVIWTFQYSLSRAKLLRVIRHFNAAAKRPLNYHEVTCLQWHDKLVMWNGNHRAAAAILVGRKIPVIRVIDAHKLARKKLVPTLRVVKVRGKKKS